MSVFSFTETRELRKSVIAGTALLVLIIGLAYYFFNSSGNTLLKRNGLEALPEHTAVAIQFRNDATSLQILTKNSFFQNLLGDTALPELQWLGRLFSMENTAAEGLKDARITLSAHQVRAERPDFLVIAEINNPSAWSPFDQSFQSILSEKNTLIERQFENSSLFELRFSAQNRSLNFSLQNNLLIASTNPFLVEDAIRQLKNGKPAIPTAFLKKEDDKNRSAINVFIHYHSLPDAFQSVLNIDKQPTLSFIKNLNGWSKLSLIMQGNAISLTGATEVSDTLNNFLQVLRTQEATEMLAAELLPNRTAAFLSIGISDYPSYMTAYKQLMSSNNAIIPYLSQVLLAKERYNLDLEQELKRWNIGELSLALTESSGDSLKDNLLALVRLDNPEQADRLFNKMAGIDSVAFPRFRFSQNYHNRKIRFLNLPGILYVIGGNLYSDFQRPYFVNINNYLIFSNKLSELKKFIDDVDALELLERQEAYANLKSYSGAEGNLQAFATTARNLQLIRANTKLTAVDIAHNHPIDFNNLYGFLFQISHSNKRLFTNLSATYFSGKKEGTSLLWSLGLDTAIATRPQVAINHNSNEKEIVVQDLRKQLYLINNTGKVIWKVQLPESIISSIYQVDYYKNGKLQLLFNTASHLYLIDRLGNTVPGYPKRLGSSATAGLSIFDYENDQNYRLFVPCSNGAIYGYQLSGAPLEGWSPRSGLGIVRQPLFFARINGKDYLATGNTEGTVRFLNRRGEILAEIKTADKKKVFNKPYSAFVDEATQTYHLINTDEEGLVYDYSSDGSLHTATASILSNTHLFGYEDISGDRGRELIFLDNNQLLVYQQKDTALVYNYSFSENVTTAPQYIKVDSSKNSSVAIVSTEGNKVFAFDDKGKVLKGFPVKGSTPFTIDDLRKDGKKYLIVGSRDQQLYVYRLD